ncbi:MAG: TetR/AcrR family transcriptional regulator [Bacillota bacterium]|nr:TetR/AcrR family transcriptional regulator [Bacillota bacterium]
MNEKDRRVIRTKNSIKTAFMKLLQEKPIGSISISELAERANIDRRTFYLHYTCIEDIIAAIEKEDALRIREALTDKEHFTIDSFLKFLTDMMVDNLDYYTCIIKTPTYSQFEHNCKDILKECIKNAFYEDSHLSEIEFDVYAEYVSSGIMGVYTQWIRTDSDLSLESLTALATEAVSDGWKRILDRR